jgi:hypothetical protein
VTVRLLLDEHFSEVIAERLRQLGHDVVAVVADPSLRAQPDAEVYRWAAVEGRRVVTENVKDYRPLLLGAYENHDPVAPLLLVASGRFLRGGRRASAVVSALEKWLTRTSAGSRPYEDWLI